MSALKGKTILNSHVVIRKPFLRTLSTQRKIAAKRLSHIGASLPTASNINFSSFSSFGPQHSTALLNEQLSFNTLAERSFASESEVDVSSITLGAPKKGKAGNIFVPIEYGGRKLRIQTPALRTPFGASRYKTEKGEEIGQLTIQLSLDQADSNPKVKGLIDLVNKVDELVLSHAKKHSKLWFPGKNYLPDHVANSMIKSIKSHKDKDFAPLLRLKIDTPKGEPALDIYLNDEPAPVEALSNNCTIVTIIEPRSVYLLWSGGYGIVWVARQVKIVNRPKASVLDANAFREETPELENVAPKAKSPNPRPPIADASPAQRDEVDAVLDEKSSADEIIEGDEEVEDAEYEEELPPPKTAKPPVKQVPVKTSVVPPKAAVKATTVPAKQVPTKTVAAKVPVKQTIPVKQATPVKQTVTAPKVAAPVKATAAPKKK